MGSDMVLCNVGMLLQDAYTMLAPTWDLPGGYFWRRRRKSIRGL
jgi:hypothetical protein